jgi:DtxR family transcriptional regulator, Mn-dependent transcriptional regulator
VAHDLIDSTEMYLRTVLELEEEGIPALRARLSERLGLSAPSVSEGVARLEDQGLLTLAGDRTVGLTGEGRQRAEQVMRKHRLAERLLVDVLGVEREHVHEEACRWEHVISDRVEDKLVEFLGNPTTSPYGNPIPGSEYDDVGDLTNLSAVAPGRVTVHRISEQLQSDHDVMRRFDEHGLRSGRTVAVRHEDGRIVIDVDGETIGLTPDAAKLVYVTAG